MTFSLVRVVTFFVAAALLLPSSSAQTRKSHEDASGAPLESQLRERINAGTIGLAGGLLEGAPIHFGDRNREGRGRRGVAQVLPIVTNGPTENVNDLLYLKGIDAAIINTDSLEEYKAQVPEIQQRIGV